MNRKEYSSAIKKTAYKYNVSKQIAKLMLNGNEWKDILDQCYINNSIQIDSEVRRHEIISVVYSRLCALDNYLLQQLCDGDITTSKYILAYAIAKSDKLFFEFLFEKYREALMTDRNYLSTDDFDSFVAHKKETNLIVSKWGKHTVACLVKGYRNILVESGLGIRIGRSIEVKKMIIHPEVIEHIVNRGDKAYIEAMLGGVS